MVVYADSRFLYSLYGHDANSAEARTMGNKLKVPLAFTQLQRHELRSAFRLAVFRKVMTEDRCAAVLAGIEADIKTGVLVEAPRFMGRSLFRSGGTPRGALENTRDTRFRCVARRRSHRAWHRGLSHLRRPPKVSCCQSPVEGQTIAKTPSVARPIQKWNRFAPEIAVDAEVAVECPHDGPVVHLPKFRRCSGLAERSPGP